MAPSTDPAQPPADSRRPSPQPPCPRADRPSPTPPARRCHPRGRRGPGSGPSRPVERAAGSEKVLDESPQVPVAARGRARQVGSGAGSHRRCHGGPGLGHHPSRSGDGCVLSHGSTVSPISAFVLNERDKRPSGVRSALVRPSVWTRAILRPHTSAKNFDYERHQVPETSRPSSENFWTVADSRRRPTPRSPLPHVNLSVTNRGGRHRAHPALPLPRCRLRGRRPVPPGCFRPLIRGPVSQLTDRHRPSSSCPARHHRSLQRVAATLTTRATELLPLTSGGGATPDPTAQLMAGLVETIAGDRGITRVAPVAEQAGLTGAQPAATLRRSTSGPGQMGHPALPPAGRGRPWPLRTTIWTGRHWRRAGLRRPGAPETGRSPPRSGYRRGTYARQARCRPTHGATLTPPSSERRVGCASNTRSVGYPPRRGRYPQDFPGRSIVGRSLRSPTTR